MEKTNSFAEYLDPSFSLEDRLRVAFDELGIGNADREAIMTFLNPLKIKDEATYRHSLRVGLVARKMARFMHMDEKALLYAGLLHDVGKCLISRDVLQKTEGWTEKDSREMKAHVLNSFKFLQGKFDFSAEVVLWHHRFQAKGYPRKIPSHLHEYGEGTKVLIATYGRILAMADVYDALHRINEKFGEKRALTGEEIKEKMIQFNIDQKGLINQLYDANVLTAYLFDESEHGQKELDEHDQLYLEAWPEVPLEIRNPSETARLIMLSAALEPLSDKSGCTTRHRNITKDQKLEYFITGAINLGQAFEKLSNDVLDESTEILRSNRALNLGFLNIYRYALRAQKDSKRNRRGGRVNQGIIELLVPIVTAQFLYDCLRQKSGEEILEKATFVLGQTGANDVQNLREMKRFAYDLSGYYDRVVNDWPVENVYSYYQAELEHSERATSVAHNNEFVNGFPTVLKIYQALQESSLPDLSSKIEEAYDKVKSGMAPEVASGFLADCVAVAIYLVLSQNPKIKLVI